MITELVITSGQTTSAIAIGDWNTSQTYAATVLHPAAMTGTSFSIQAKFDATWRTITAVGGGDGSIPFVANAATPLDPSMFISLKGKQIRIVSNATEGADRTFGISSEIVR